jgi:hypothetical protein
MKPFGLNLTFGDNAWKAASLTTDAQPDGTYEFFTHLLGGPGVQRHLHGYAEVTTGGLIVRGGARLKNDVNTHLGPGIQSSHSTQEIARFRVELDEDGVRTHLLQCIDDSWRVTSASTWGGPITRRPVLLPGSLGVQGAEYSLAMFDAAAVPSSNAAAMVILPFSAPLPFGVSVTLLRKW